MINLMACSWCGKVHAYGQCKKPRIYNRHRTDKQTDAKAFRSSARWQRKRKQILERDYYLCRLCFHNGIINNKNLSVHHIKSIMSGGDKLEDNNLITLCRTCHEIVENNDSFIPLLSTLVHHPPMLRN